MNSAERSHLDRRGYVLLEGVLSPTQVALMRSALQQLLHQEVGGAAELANPQNMSAAGDAFDVCLTHPRVLDAVTHVLGPSVATLGIYSRALAPSVDVEKTYKEALHTDYSGHLHPDGTMHLSEDGLVVDSSSPAPTGRPFHTCNTHWMLTDFHEANGATRVVPGSVRCSRHGAIFAAAALSAAAATAAHFCHRQSQMRTTLAASLFHAAPQFHGCFECNRL